MVAVCCALCVLAAAEEAAAPQLLTSWVAATASFFGEQHKWSCL